jgi:hypothetical protein
MLAVIAGCTGKPGLSTVTGNVMLDGAPLKSGSIRFTPVDGRSSPGEAIIEAGKFSVEMPPGEKRVSISSPKIVGKRKAYQTPDSPEVDVVEEVLPARYNAQTELTFAVQAGSQEKDFELTSKR